MISFKPLLSAFTLKLLALIILTNMAHITSAGPGTSTIAQYSINAKASNEAFVPYNAFSGFYSVLQWTEFPEEIFGQDLELVRQEHLLGGGIIRTWLILDMMRFGDDRNAADWERVHEYFDEMTKFPGVLMLNVHTPGKPKEDSMTVSEWGDWVEEALHHLAERYPGKIRYIESANEPFAHHADDPIEVYKLYKEINDAVNAVNSRLELSGTEQELLIGGPTIGTTTPVTRVRDFLELYIADTDPSKRLDFVTAHRYADGPNVRGFATLVDIIQGWLTQSGLAGTPVLLTETSMWSWRHNSGLPLPEDMAITAAGTLSLHYWTKQAGGTAFYFGSRHRQNSRKDAFLDDEDLGRSADLTAYGYSRLFLGKMAEEQLPVSGYTDNQDPDGRGLYLLASRNSEGTRITLLAWNYQYDPRSQPARYNVRINLDELPEGLKGNKLKVRRWLIDAEHSNAHFTGSATDLHLAEDRAIDTQDTLLSLGFPLHPNAVTLLEISTAQTKD